MQTKFNYSFEVFPPKTLEGIQTKETVWSHLQALQPNFISVTFGAGGSTQSQTLALVKHLQQKNIDVTPHLSCINLTKATILDLLEQYKRIGIKRLIVIRGDLPIGQTQQTGDFNHACDLVAFIREHFDHQFAIIVAAYPEFHPETNDALSDFKHFKAKVDAGADAAITQYFFNCDAYCRFMDLCSTNHINIPIIPGIMPIYNFTKLMRFSKICQADIPQWLAKRLEAFSEDEQSLQAFGLDVTTQLCQDLRAKGAPALHFYTLNQSFMVEKILYSLGIQVKAASVA
ncbi:MAG: methylenetetrahydrofolate reductase [NAD(P)H] [Pseudomonadota bacterium]